MYSPLLRFQLYQQAVEQLGTTRVDQLAFYGIKLLLRVEKWIIILFEILHSYQHENTDEGLTCELQTHIYFIKVNDAFFNPFQTLVLLFFPF